MEGLLYKFSPAPEPLPTQDSGNPLLALSMFWIQLSRHQVESLENGKRDQELASTLAALPFMLNQLCLSSTYKQDLSLHNSMSHLTHHFTIKRIFEGLPLDIKWLQATCFKGNSNTPATTQREPHASDLLLQQSPLPTLPTFSSSSIDDSDFQDQSPIQPQPDLQGPSSSEGAQGWHVLKSQLLQKEVETSDGETSDHSATTLRIGPFAVALLCTALPSTTPEAALTTK
jgi:hypothetical protein